MNRMKLSVVVIAVALAAMVVWTVGCGGTSPGITAVTPVSGRAGTIVLITGTSFGATQGSGKVVFGNATATVATWTDTRITTSVPKDLKVGKYVVKVTTSAGSSGGINFTVTQPSSTSSQPQPATTQTQMQVIQTYAAANNISLIGPDGQLTISLFKASEIDPDWQLWQMPLGEGLDVRYFLLKSENGEWVVVDDFLENGNPQSLGAPSDLTLPQVPSSVPTSAP